MTASDPRTGLHDRIIGSMQAPIVTPRDLGPRPEVLAELPVTDDTGQARTLIATPDGLIVSRDDPIASDGRMAGDHVHWSAVRLAATEGAGDAWFGLRVNVGGAAFHAWLQGESGRRALRDFVVLVQAHRDGAEPAGIAARARH